MRSLVFYYLYYFTINNNKDAEPTQEKMIKSPGIWTNRHGFHQDHKSENNRILI